MGKTKITTIGSKIIIGDQTFETTPGLWSLIMLNTPHGYTNEDYAVYRVIAEITDVANNPQNVGNGRPQQTRKYELLKKLYEGEEEEQEGEGMPWQNPGPIYEPTPNERQLWNHLAANLTKGKKGEKGGHGMQFLPGDIQGLFSKLGLLIAEFKAGNYNTRNQIVAILDELKRRKQLTNKKYREINNFLGSGFWWQRPPQGINPGASTY